jgi:hypothetical protein
MSERDSENFEIDDNTDYDGLLARVDKRVRTQGKKGKAAWSKLEEVLADRKLEKDLRELFDEE